jgi:hypothetical protein
VCGLTVPAAVPGEDSRLLEANPFEVWEGVVDRNSGDIEVCFPLSSSKKGLTLEAESEGMSRTKEISGTALSTASF